MNPVRLVYIAGAGRSGSTLFDLLLGRHPQICSVGEVHRLCAYARTGQVCTCGLAIVECPFWLDVAQRYAGRESGDPADTLRDRELMFRPDALSSFSGATERALLVAAPRLLGAVFPWLAGPHHDALQSSLAWYAAIRAASGCPIVVDSTKDPRRLALLHLGDPEGLRAIYMVRDGRAVAASTMRRTGVDMAAAAREWRFEHRRSRLVLRTLPAERVLRLRYEDLCTDTRGVMERAAGFLGIPFDPRMLEVDKRVSHNIGGNPMRLRKDETAVVLDDRWRTELSSADLATFDTIAGGWNRGFGYT